MRGWACDECTGHCRQVNDESGGTSSGTFAGVEDVEDWEAGAANRNLTIDLTTAADHEEVDLADSPSPAHGHAGVADPADADGEDTDDEEVVALHLDDEDIE